MYYITYLHLFFRRTSKFLSWLVVLLQVFAQFEPQLFFKKLFFPSITSIIIANTSIDLSLPDIHFGTVIKHVRHSFDFLLCSFGFCNCKNRTCHKTAHFMTRRVVMSFNTRLGVTFASEAEPRLFLACS